MNKENKCTCAYIVVDSRVTKITKENHMGLLLTLGDAADGTIKNIEILEKILKIPSSDDKQKIRNLINDSKMGLRKILNNMNIVVGEILNKSYIENDTQLECINNIQESMLNLLEIVNE